MALPVTEASSAVAFTSTTTLTGRKKLLGVFVSSSSGGTLAVADGAAAVVAAFAPASATFYPLPFEAGTSLVFTVTGTLAATAFYSV